MISKIASFELRYQFRSPTFWVGIFIFFLFGFGLTASDNVSINAGGAIHENSPWSLLLLMGVGSIFYLLVVTAFTANTIIRDDASGYAPIMRSTPVTERQMVLGRYLGGYLISAFGFLSLPLGAFVGTLMPWVDSELIGPQHASYYLWPYLVLVLPNLFLTSAFLFMLATITRSMMWSYVGVVLFVVLYLLMTSTLASDPELRQIFARFEPMGIGAVGFVTRYWTVAEQNSQIIPLEGMFLTNRIIAILYGAVFLVITVLRFSFAEKPASKRRMKKLAKRKEREEEYAAILPALGGREIRAKHRPISRTEQFFSRLKLEVSAILRSPGLPVLTMIAMGTTAATLWGSQTLYGANTYPTVAETITVIRENLAIYLIIIAAFYGGETVWRERDHKISEIIDSAPIPAWIMTVTKILAVAMILLLVILAGTLTGLIYQVSGGNTDLQLGHYVTWLLLPSSVEFMFVAALAVIVQVLSPNKYVGWGLILAWFLLSVVLDSWGLINPLYNFASGPSVPLSDLVDPAPFLLGSWTIAGYWTAIALILIVIAHLLWPRGTDLALTSRFRRLKSTGVPKPALAVGLVGVAAAVGLGLFAHHNMKVLNTFQTQDEQEKLLADFERKYLKYEDMLQPAITDVKLDIDLFPEERRMEVAGRYVLTNLHDEPIDEIHILNDEDQVKLTELDIAGATEASYDEEFGYRILKFDQPLAPGAMAEMNFKTQVWRRGFPARGALTDITPDATFINSSNFTPTIGMSTGRLLRDRQARRRQGLPPELRPAKLEEERGTKRSALGGLYWANTDITLSTSADQMPLAPGNKVSDEVSGDRRTARFVSSEPILAFISIISADYEVAARKHRDLDFSVFYHEGHEWNVERMLDAMEASLDYYEDNFGEYQFDHARIIEFPGYATFAQAFAGTMPYSERIGFVSKIDGADDTDFITYVIAHELAHQYWAHQVIGGDMQGAALTTETLASYSAIMVMKNLLGADQQRRFLKYELDAYLRGRKGEQLQELPLIRMENQAYIHYRKGGHALALLAERMGEDKVNRALANFIQKWKYRGYPFHRSTDLVTELRAVAETPEEQQLITDIFEKIVLFDLKVADVKSEEVGGKWRTSFTVEAAKYEADDKGEESEVALSETVEIGLFAKRPGFGAFDKSDVLVLDKRELKSGKTKFVLESDERPAFVGIDPYNRYIDRNSDDNLEAVSAS